MDRTSADGDMTFRRVGGTRGGGSCWVGIRQVTPPRNEKPGSPLSLNGRRRHANRASKQRAGYGTTTRWTVARERIATVPSQWKARRPTRNPGELVFSPFAGIGSELYTALKLGRQAYGCELKDEYHAEAVRNCNKAMRFVKREKSSRLFEVA